jgi:acyl carrier protein
VDDVLLILAEVLEVESTDLMEDTNFKELEEWDSLATLGVLAGVSEKFDVLISNSALEGLNTPKQLFTFINSEKK